MWRRAAGYAPAGAMTSSSGGGLTGAELEQALSGLLVTNPDIIAVRVV